jgi:uncharacterized protein (TIGR02246 family)
MTDLQTGDRNAVAAMTTRWLTALHAKDIRALMSMLSDDCIFISPGRDPLRGKAAAEALYRTLFDSYADIQQAVTVEEIQVAGDWAFSWGREQLRIGFTAGTVEFEGHGLAVLHREPDGGWLFVRGINTSVPRIRTS